MPRRIRRRIQGRFHHNCFSPCSCGINKYGLESVILTKDQMEAIRLADFKGLYQEDAAKEMEISRPTFSRILNNARKKIATALIEGRAIEIENF
jgi:predicted DNA-binding protein (UPF0251 family)